MLKEILLSRGEYLSVYSKEIVKSLQKTNKIILHSPPNTGKTRMLISTEFLNTFKRIVILLPNVMMVDGVCEIGRAHV